MPYEFTASHRVEFADTDLAGIMHFANFFRLMEETEHAFLRSLGLSVQLEQGGTTYGWPRVRAQCEYLAPLRFEDEVEVRLRVRAKKARSLTYDFLFRRREDAGMTDVARGSITAVCVTMDPATGAMKSAAIPDVLARVIQEAPGEAA